MRPIKEIIVHCSATDPKWMADKPTHAKVNEIRKWHVRDRGWRDIGYHQIIDRNGTASPGRPIVQAGAHVVGHNADTIGICLLGGLGSNEKDQFEDNFTPAQDKALRDMIAHYQRKYGPLKVSGHNQYAAKACPGFYVPDWYARPVEPPKYEPAAPNAWAAFWNALFGGRKK